jgi:hypothetical protein
MCAHTTSGSTPHAAIAAMIDPTLDPDHRAFSSAFAPNLSYNPWYTPK